MENLKTTLTSVIAGDVNHISIHILDEMIENIGTTDPVVRAHT